MSAQVNAYHNTNVGRMFARHNAPLVYTRQQTAVEKIDPEKNRGAVDTVVLSPSAPRPLSADYFEEAVAAGTDMRAGKKLSSENTARLREDRVFSALTALAVLSEDGAALPRSWPAGLPAPTREELDEARRRLAQRLQGIEQVDNPDELQQRRLQLLERAGKRASTTEESGIAPANGAAA